MILIRRESGSSEQQTNHAFNTLVGLEMEKDELMQQVYNDIERAKQLVQGLG